jgi:small-conductance mechanosensitive channel
LNTGVGGPLTPGELSQLLSSLLSRTALIEAALVLGCLLAAWLVVRLLRGATVQPGSTWFGDRIVDGALFPLLALLLALAARWALQHFWQGVVPLAVFRLVVPILLSLAIIRLTVRVLRITFPDSQLMRVFERSVSWVAWIAVVLWITGVLPLVMQELDDIKWKVGGTPISVRNIIEGLVTALLVLTLALWVSSLLEARLLRGATDNLSIRKMAANALRAILLFVGLMFALSAAGIDLTALGVLGGALGVGIGFGLQKLAANYISGFVILAERSMRIGDLVKVDGFEGRITDITTRYTVIRALNGRESIVPNEMLITQRVENSSLADPRVAMSTLVQVAYGSDLATLMPRLAQAVAAVPRVLADPAPAVQLSQFAADGLELTIAFWIADPEKGGGGVRSDVNLAILAELEAAGVEIPFPQRVMRHITDAPADTLRTAP